MATFRVGQRVRIVRSTNGHVGMEATITRPLSRFTSVKTGKVDDGHAVRIDGLGELSAMGCPFFATPDQLEPITPEGAAPSEFSTLADLLTSLEVTA